jgi:hypothetical protein
MKKSHFLLFSICCFLLSVILWGCGGGGPGAPGSTNSEDTGIILNAVTITTENGPDLDVYSAPLACPASSPTGPETLLHREDATITIDASKLNPGTTSNPTFDPFPASVEQCTITYKKAIEDPSAPVIESLTIYPNCSIVNSTTNSCPVTLIDITRKEKYWTDLTSGINLPAEQPTHYVAVYNCSYTNIVGKSGQFEVEYDIWLGDFLNCS